MMDDLKEDKRERIVRWWKGLSRRAKIAGVSASLCLIGSPFAPSIFGPTWNLIQNVRICLWCNYISGNGEHSSAVSSPQNNNIQDSGGNRYLDLDKNPEQICLSSDVPVPCDTSHNGEMIVNASSCDPGVLVNYLGGIVSVDTPMSGISYESTPKGCRVKFPFYLEESVDGKWQDASRQLPELRSCFNPDRADQFVSCGEPHTGEVVYHQPDGDSAHLLCDAKAVDYMKTEKRKWEDILETKGIEDNGSWICVAETRNDNLLDGTLRSLGTQKIKTKPR